MSIDYMPLFFVVLIAWVVPMVLLWMNVSKFPSVVVEIIMGVLIGPFVFNIVSGDEPYMKFLSYTGFLFLIFLSGLALDVQKILSSFPHRRALKKVDFLSNTFIVASLIYIGSLLLSGLAVYTIPFFEDTNKLFLTILFPSVALSMVVPVIKKNAEIYRKFGQIILLEGALSTIMTIVLITLYAGIQRNSGFEFEMLLFFVIFIVFFIAYKVGATLVKKETFQKLSYQLEHAAHQIRIRGSIVVLLFFVITAKLINTEPFLGAFFAGLLLSIFLSKERSALLFKLDGMSYGFFIPIFFISVGIKLDIGNLTNVTASLNLILVFTLVIYGTQVFPSLILTKLFGFKKAISAGVLLASRLGLTIATAQIGLSLDIISTATNAAIVAASILSCVISLSLYNFLTHQNKIKKYYNTYIIGGSSIAIELAKALNMHQASYVIIEPRKNLFEQLISMNIDALYVDVERIETYRSMGIRAVDTMVILTESNDKNIRIANMLRKELGSIKMITISESPTGYTTHNALNEVQVINPHHVLASYLENEIDRPGTSGSLLKDSFGSYRMEEIILHNERIHNEFIKNIPFPKSGSLVVIRRNDDMLIPHGNTQLLLKDHITVIGKNDTIIDFKRLFEVTG